MVKNNLRKEIEYNHTEEEISMVCEQDNNFRDEYFRNKNSILFKGDVLDERLFEKEFIDLIVTSPPYNVGID